MSIPTSGIFSRSAGVISAIAKQLRLLNLKPVKRIVVQFDPFHDHASETRKFLFHITTPKIVTTNPNCVVRTNVVCDRSEPKVTFNLESGENVVIKTTNLSALNILHLYNKYVTSTIAPDPEEVQAKQALEELKKKSKGKRKKYKREAKRRPVFL